MKDIDNINPSELEAALESIRNVVFECSPYKQNCKNDIAFKAGIDCVLDAIKEMFEAENEQNK